MTPSITQDDVNTALGNFLQTVTGLPDGQVIIGQSNRVASPEGDYIVFWPLRRPRLSTNVDTPVDAVFTGSIAPIDADTAAMTITAANPDFTGQLGVGSQIFGVGLAQGTVITALASSPSGGVGTYIVAPSQTVASRTLSAGAIDVDQSTEIVMQVDVHGPASGDLVQTISTLFRDQYAVDQFEGSGVVPLYAEDPRQLPFTTAAVQYEDRWSIDLHMQVHPVIAVPQQFATAATINVVSVDATYPP